MTENQRKPRIVDNPDAREIYINRTIGTAFDGAAITILLGCARVVPERVDTPPQQSEPPAVHLTARIALSLNAAVELANALNGILATIAKDPAGPVSVFSTTPPSRPN